MAEMKTRPWWLENREPERPMMPCLDLDEVIAWGRLYEATMSTTENRVRQVCQERGIPFTPEMQAAFGSVEPA